MNKLCFLFLFLPCLLLACKSAPDTPEHPVTDHELLAETTDTSKTAATAAPSVYQMPDSAALLHYVVDTTGLSPEPDTQVKILLEGLFHKEDVWSGAADKNWFGLFDNHGTYELRPTTLTITPAFDPVADARTEISTGRKVISGREVRGNDAQVMLFITGMPGLKAGPVDTAAFSRAVIRPGRKLKLTFRKSEYMVTAFGDSTLLESGEYVYNDYGWKISGTKKGRKIEQVLAQDALLLGSIYMLHWAGDLDRDGIPDLVAELSNHYNITRTVLFLSATASKGDLYKKAAVFESASR